MTITFDPYFFTNVFYKIWQCDKRFCISYGGAGSGKSYAQAQKEVIKLVNDNNKHDTLIVMKTAATMYDTVYNQIKTVISSFCIEDKFKFSYSNDKREIKFLPTGARFIFKGLDDSEKIKSIVNVRRVWGEEASSFERKDFMELNRRVRGVSNIQFSYTFNPVSPKLAIKQLYMDTKLSNCDIFKSTYRDNHFLDAEYIAELQRLHLFDPDQARIYAEGEFGIDRTGFEYHSQFRYEIHTKENINFIPELPVFISFDQNVIPYITMLCFQVIKIENKYQIRLFDELCLKNPKNTTEALCKEFELKYGSHLTSGGLYYYGDASGRHRDTRGIENDYTIVERVLKKYLNNNSNRVPRSNPPHNKRRPFINRLLAGMYPLELVINRKCVNVIEDLETVKEAADGTMLKEKTRESGVSFESVGHTSDALHYFLCSHFKNYYESTK